MQLRLIAVCQHRDDRRWRQDGDAACGARNLCAILIPQIGTRTLPQQKQRLRPLQDEASGGQVLGVSLEPNLGAATLAAHRVQMLVDLCR